MWIIPKVVPQIREEFLPLLKCKTWRKKLCNDKISIIRKPRVGMRLYFYNSKLFIWETVVDWNRIVRDYLPSLKDCPPPDCLLLFCRQSANQILEEGVPI